MNYVVTFVSHEQVVIVRSCQSVVKACAGNIFYIDNIIIVAERDVYTLGD